MKKKKYTVRVNCPCFEDIDVIAKTDKEAIEIAEHEFQCSANAPGDSSEILTKGEFVFDCGNHCKHCKLIFVCPDTHKESAT